MIKKLITRLAVCACAFALFASCNSDDSTTAVVESQSARLLAFHLRNNASVAPSLDSVYFSIDQVKGEVYNADSLPYGTDVSKIVPYIQVASSSVIELTVRRANGTDTIYDYLTNPDDSISFVNPVRLRIVSSDAQSTAGYTLKVNVHQIPTDTLVWGRLDRASLPSSFTVVNEQHTAFADDTFYCLTRYGSSYCLATTTDPAGSWTYSTPGFSFVPDLDNFCATATTLYILDKDGNLYTSSDRGATWKATGRKCTYFYGTFGENLIASVLEDSGNWKRITYPAGVIEDIPADFPVEGSSPMTQYDFPMSSGPQSIIVGGRTSDGNLIRATWGYDGKIWACFAKNALPEALEGMTVFPYYLSIVNDSTWTYSRRSVMVAMMGNREDGSPSDTVYVSPDMGMHWSKADSLMQPSRTLPARTFAQAYTHVETIKDKQQSARRGSMSWLSLVSELPMLGRPASRATAPITEWECPYIYLFGGKNADLETYNTLYRGVIARFTFRPLQ